MRTAKGLFVALEGIDGSGKTTQVYQVAELLNKIGHKAHPTHEPTKSQIGKMLRDYLANPDSIPLVDALLFAADRIEHYNGEILSYLKKNYIVITDRFKYSSMIYQGFSGVPVDWIVELNKMVPDPDITILINISLDTAIGRLNNSQRTHLEKFETKKKLGEIKTNYDVLSMKNLIIVNGENSEREVTKNIVDNIIEFTQKNN